MLALPKFSMYHHGVIKPSNLLCLSCKAGIDKIYGFLRGMPHSYATPNVHKKRKDNLYRVQFL